MFVDQAPSRLSHQASLDSFHILHFICSFHLYGKQFWTQLSIRYNIFHIVLSIVDFLSIFATSFGHKMIFPKNRTSTISTFASIGIIWIIPSILLYLISYTNLNESFSSPTLSFLVIVFFIFLLSSTMVIFLRYERNYLYKNNNIRRNLIISLILLRLLLFQIERIDSFVGILAGIIGTTTLILFACLLGSYLSQAIKRLPELIPVCSVAFTVDLYSVLQGPSKEIAVQIGEFYGTGAKGSAPYVDIILMKITNPAVDYLTPIFGVSDWIFAVFLTSTLLQFKVADSVAGKDITKCINTQNVPFYFPLVSIALLACIFIANISNIFVPALPVMIMIVLPWLIIRNLTLFNMTASDYYLSLIAPLFAAIFYFLTE